MLSRKPLTRCLLSAGLLAAVSSCAAQVTTRPLFPPAADIRDATTPKPVPTPDILTSEQAAERYDAAVETWGETVSRAGGRICRWVIDNGGTLPFKCPPQPK